MSTDLKDMTIKFKRVFFFEIKCNNREQQNVWMISRQFLIITSYFIFHWIIIFSILTVKYLADVTIQITNQISNIFILIKYLKYLSKFHFSNYLLHEFNLKSGVLLPRCRYYNNSNNDRQSSNSWLWLNWW